MDFMQLIFEKAAESDRMITAAVSSESIDRDGDIVTAEAMAAAMPEFMKNPVILCSHKHKLESGQSSVVGRVVRWWQRDKKTLCEIQFASTPLGEEYWQLYQGKFQRAFSIGFNTKKHEQRLIDGKSISVITEIELYEISAVAVPSNREALSKTAQRKRAFIEAKRLAPFSAEDIAWMDTEEKAFFASLTFEERRKMIQNAEEYAALITMEGVLPGDGDEFDENAPESILAGKGFDPALGLDLGEIASPDGGSEAVEPDYADLFA